MLNVSRFKLNDVFEMTQVAIGFLLAAAYVYVFIVIPGVGTLMGAIALAVLIVGIGALVARRYVKSVKK